jgi:rare lipoprotein A
MIRPSRKLLIILRHILKTEYILAFFFIISSLFSGCSHMHAPERGWQQVGTASWYGKDFHGKPTASGEIYNMYGYSAAHKTLPLGTRVRVTNMKNNRQIVVPINDRGPFVGRRIIDMSYGAARHLGMVKEGLAKVHVEVIQTSQNLRSGYTLQFGAYEKRQNAVTMADKLTTIGYTPSIEEAFVRGKKFHRVRLGTFSSFKRAQEFSKAFHQKDISYRIVGL